MSVTIKEDFGTIVTKSAVEPIELKQGYHLLESKMTELIKESRGNPMPGNALITRNQRQEREREMSAEQD